MLVMQQGRSAVTVTVTLQWWYVILGKAYVSFLQSNGNQPIKSFRMRTFWLNHTADLWAFQLISWWEYINKSYMKVSLKMAFLFAFSTQPEKHTYKNQENPGISITSYWYLLNKQLTCRYVWCFPSLGSSDFMQVVLSIYAY